MVFVPPSLSLPCYSGWNWVRLGESRLCSQFASTDRGSTPKPPAQTNIQFQKQQASKKKGGETCIFPQKKWDPCNSFSRTGEKALWFQPRARRVKSFSGSAPFMPASSPRCRSWPRSVFASKGSLTSRIGQASQPNFVFRFTFEAENQKLQSGNESFCRCV